LREPRFSAAMLFTREQQSHLPRKTTIKTMSDLSDKPQLRKKTEQEQEQRTKFCTKNNVVLAHERRQQQQSLEKEGTKKLDHQQRRLKLFCNERAANCELPRS
jgi:hypothetical protein